MNKSNQPEVDWLIFGLSATLLALDRKSVV
jgi:hypothetical protein